MAAYIIRRLILSVIVLLLVTILVFLLIQIVPGDPALIMLGQDATPEQLASLRSDLWLDRPLPIQYWHWLSNAVTGDLGTSLIFRQSVISIIAERLPITVYLSLISVVISSILGIAAGIICAIRRGRYLDTIVTFFSNIGIAIPIFWLGILGIYFLGLKLGWLPIQGYTSPLVDFGKSMRQMIMPIICLSIFPLTVLARQTRSSMLDVVRQDYIRTAWAKGLKERTIVLKHALKNALIPIVTLIGMEIRIVVGGSVLIEQVFNIPGMGRLMMTSIFNKDLVVVQGCTLIIAIAILIANLLVDISYGYIDPRIRYE